MLIKKTVYTALAMGIEFFSLRVPAYGHMIVKP